MTYTKKKDRVEKARKAAERSANPVAEANASTSLGVEPVAVETEPQSTATVPAAGGFLGGVLDRAQSRLQATIGVSDDEGEEDAPEAEPAKKKWYKSGQSKQKAEVGEFVGKLLVVLVTAWNVPEELKPTTDETTALAEISTRLLLRHINIAGKMTQDAIDAIGIVAIMSGWYARTAPGWKARQANIRALKSQASTATVSDEPPIPAEGYLIPRGKDGRPTIDPRAATA